MARRKTLGKYYYKNRQKNHSKKANNRRSVKKRTIGGMFPRLRNLITRRHKNAAGNSANNDPFPNRRELSIATDQGRRQSVLDRISGLRAAKNITSRIWGSSVPALHTTAIAIEPDIPDTRNVFVSEHQDRILKDKILENSQLIRFANEDINEISEMLPTIFEKLGNADNSDIKGLYMRTISQDIHKLPLEDFNKSETQKFIELLANINSNVIVYSEKLTRIVEVNTILFSPQEYSEFFDIVSLLDNMRGLSGYDNFTTTTRTYVY